MIYKGSDDFLNLSPYIVSQGQKSLLSFVLAHWFLIQIISSFFNLSSFGNDAGISFTSDNMVSNGWFCMYLNETQISYLTKNYNKIKLYPIEKMANKQILSAKNGDYYISAAPDWKPPNGSKIVSRISNTLYFVKNLTITPSIENDDRILSITSAPRKKLLNRYTAGFLQNSHQKSYYDNNMYSPVRSLHNIGLNGTGQIINIVDTGIDINNPFFYDENNALDTISGKTNYNHRKIIRIETYADDKDYFRGHGTHVGGIAAGSAFCAEKQCGIAQYDGIAKGAKIYLSDVGFASISGDLSEEFDLAEQSVLLKKYGAYISSNSWSYDNPTPFDEYIYNKVSYENQELLYLFAAGNDYNYFTINTPSNAKNLLSIGATNPASSNAAESLTSDVIVEGPGGITVGGSDITDSRQIWKSGIASNMKYFVNISIVHYLDSSSANYSNSIVVITQTDVSKLCQDYYSAINANAKAVIVTTTNYFRCNVYTIPLIKVSADSKDKILNMKNASILPYPGAEGSLPSVAYLSSKGPSRNTLSKPDFAVPGKNIYSAKSLGVNSRPPASSEFADSIEVKDGTSMATPAAAGLAAIVRQFLVDGWYPGLFKNSGKSIIPSSFLMKAVLINSANSKEVGPGFEVGFGIPCLEKVFGMQGAGLRLLDHEVINSESHKVYKINLENNSADLSVTMTYIDPPLSSDNQAHLFADLDLVIKAPNGKYYIGNNVSVANSDAFSSSERVIVKKEEIVSGEYEIHTISSEYPLDQSVSYALVVNGPFSQNASDKNPFVLVSKNSKECISNCNGKGTCNNNGRCECKDGYTGLTCATDVIEMHEGDVYQSAYTHKKINYFKFTQSNKSISEANTANFKIQKDYSSATVKFCISTTKVGSIADGYWSCYMVSSSEKTYSAQLSNDKAKLLYLAVYTSYHFPVNVEIQLLEFGEQVVVPTKTPKVINYVLYFSVPLGIIVLIAAVTITVFCFKRRNKPITENNETVDPTVMIDDAFEDMNL